MVEYASGSIKFSGLGSDTDFQEMIDKLSKVESRYVNQLLQWKADWGKRIEAFQQVRSELLNMQTALTGINSMNKFLSKSAVSSKEEVATGIADANALNGTYTLEVDQLASQYSWSKATGVYDKNAVFATANGEFKYRYKGVERTLNIPNGTTLEGLRNIINNDSNNLGVRAQLLNSQDGYVFQLHSRDTGSANTLTIQSITNMPALGNITLTPPTYIEEESSMTLAQGFTAGTDIINTGTDSKTFIFTVDGKKKSIAVPGGADIQWLVDEINAWGAANIPSRNNEDIASLEPGAGGLVYFTLGKRDSVYGAGTYSDDLLNVLATSYAAKTDPVNNGQPGLYEVEIINPDGSTTNASTSLVGGESLEDLRALLQASININGGNTQVSIAADPKAAGNVKLVFGPAADANMQNILNQNWTNFDSQIDTTVERKYEFRLSNSDVGLSSADLISITLPKDSTWTITDFKNALNTRLGNRGTALLEQDGGGNWKLWVEGGSATHRVTVEDGTLDDLKYKPQGEASGEWQVNQGKNSRVRVNGWPNAPAWLETASNNIPSGEVIDGMSVTLRGIGTTVISVANDTETIIENVESFVEAVNNFRTVLQSVTAYDEKKATVDPDYAESQFEMQKGAVLTGNYGIQLLSSRLKTAISGTGVGFVHLAKDAVSGFSTGDVFSALSQIGISTNAEEGHVNYGLLEINRIPGFKGMKSLDEALAQDPEAVARLFSTRSEGASNNQDLFQHKSHIAGITRAGEYSVEYTIDASDPAGPVITSAFINGMAATVDNANMTISLSDPAGKDPARGIILGIYNLSGGTHTGSVSIKDGKVNELLDMMTGTEGLLGSGGTLAHLENNYQTISDNIEKKIKQEDDRLVKWRRTMDLKFSRLEAVLAKYNNLNEGLKSQIAKLNDSNK